MKDDLGSRMKGQYEDRSRFMLPRRTWTVIRADGKAFHTFTRRCAKPFDNNLHAAMISGAMTLVTEAQGAKIAYVQSDEISVILTDFDDIRTEAWFDGNVQKIASVSASLVTMGFNAGFNPAEAVFDARCYTIPDPVEVENYLIWRQKDAIRNSASALAQAHFSAKQLHGQSRNDMLGMLAAKGIEWTASPVHVQRGTVIRRNGGAWTADYSPPIFTEDRDYMRAALAPAPSGEPTP